MTDITILDLAFPPTDNHLYANVPGKGRVKTERYRTWLRDADNRYLTQKRFVKPITGHFNVIITLDERQRLTQTGDLRKRDCPNYNKASLDALVRWGVVEDDHYCDRLTIEWGTAPEGARVEVYSALKRREAA